MKQLRIFLIISFLCTTLSAIAQKENPIDGQLLLLNGDKEDCKIFYKELLSNNNSVFVDRGNGKESIMASDLLGLTLGSGEVYSSEKIEVNGLEQVSLLSVLVEGKATLLEYNIQSGRGKKVQFIKKKGDGALYALEGKRKVGMVTFLFSDCEAMTPGYLKNKKMKTSGDLVKLVEQYNTCGGDTSQKIYYVQEKYFSLSDFGVRIAYSNTNFKNRFSSTYSKFDFSSDQGIDFGIYGVAKVDKILKLQGELMIRNRNHKCDSSHIGIHDTSWESMKFSFRGISGNILARYDFTNSLKKLYIIAGGRIGFHWIKEYEQQTHNFEYGKDHGFELKNPEVGWLAGLGYNVYSTNKLSLGLEGRFVQSSVGAKYPNYYKSIYIFSTTQIGLSLGFK